MGTRSTTTSEQVFEDRTTTKKNAGHSMNQDLSTNIIHAVSIWEQSAVYYTPADGAFRVLRTPTTNS